MQEQRESEVETLNGEGDAQIDKKGTGLEQSDMDIEKGSQSPGQSPSDAKLGQDPNVVRWEVGDKDDPRNWSLRYRAFCTLQLGLLAMAASMGSSIISPSAGVIASEFHISQQVTVFNISLYVLGFAFGPLLWAGISETFGRRWSLLPPMLCLGVFSIGSAVSKSAAALFVTRFFGGLFGSAPVSNVGAALGDMYAPKARGIAISLYALAVIGGPTIGPVIGAALTVKVSWRWSEYITAIYVFAVTVFEAFFLPETYAPVLLKKRAQQLRKTTGNEALYHPHELVKLDPKSVLTKQITRPLVMLCTEPIVTAISLYASFVYSLLYMTLEIFSIIFLQLRQWPLISSTLPFLALFVGIVCALAINLGNAPYYNRAVDKAGGKPVPEARLPPMFIGAIFFCAGLFWMGWTATPNYPWILPVLAAAFIGAGFNIIFQQCINFLVDSYK